MTRTTVPPASDLALARRLLLLARPYWPQLAAVLVLDLATTPLAILAPVPLKIAIDGVLGGQGPPAELAFLVPSAADPRAAALVMATALLVTIAVVRQFVDLASAYLRTSTGEKLVLEFRARLFRHSQRVSLAYHDTYGAADSIYRINWDVPSIRHIAVDGVVPLVVSTATLAGIIAVTASIDGALALVALGVAPVLFFLNHWYRRPLRVRHTEVKVHETSALRVVQEVLSSLRVVKAFGREDHEHERFVRESGEGTRARIRLALFQGGFDLLVGFTTAVGTATVLYIGVQHVLAGTLTTGGLVMVLAYLGMIYAPLRSISGKATDVQASLAGAERAFALLDAPPDVPERPDARPLARAAGAVEFRHVSFQYGPDRTVIGDVSFDVPAGARVGIAGPTGAGKTTLMSLLARFYDPTEGEILLDGVDLRALRVADLRNQFSIVLQEPVLFSTSIADNIAYARPDATSEDIVAAAKAANAHDFIAALPQGYESQVGERGMSLSGGERQRISLARAFLKNAPILVLDEPTSSVDVKTETGIMDAMERLMHGRTTFLIAHRLSTLDGCDVRIELEKGRLAGFRSAAGRQANATGAGSAS